LEKAIRPGVHLRVEGRSKGVGGGQRIMGLKLVQAAQVWGS